MDTNNRPKVNRLSRRVLCLIVLCLVAFSSEGCEGWYIEFSTPVIHPASCPIEELLLDVSAFPSGSWQEMGPPSERNAPVRIGIERIGTSFSDPSDFTLQQVYRFEGDRKAKSAYREEVESWFIASSHETEWIKPPELDNLVVNTDQFRAGCHDEKSGGREQCQYVAQYGPYILRLLGGMRSLSYEDFIKLVKDIDQRAINCIK